MAHGKHRRTKRTSSNDLRPRPRSLKSFLRDYVEDGSDRLLQEVQKQGLPRVSVAGSDLAADFITQEHMVHDGDSQDRTELRFRLLACEHPGLCACESAYPNWKPGQR